MSAESLAKAYILTNGVRFTQDALCYAEQVNAKRQNMVYNRPANDSDGLSTGHTARPQELFLTGDDNYKVCVSAVTPVEERSCAVVDYSKGVLTVATPSRPSVGERVALVEYVPQPSYYSLTTTSGRPVTRWVSACGYDEMNVWPWHDCAIGQTCTFCGINAVLREAGKNVDLIHALELRQHSDYERRWESHRAEVLSEITEAVQLAIDDECYSEEIHLILISGNLANHQLDLQAIMYSEIAAAIVQNHPDRFAEDVVAVTAPPTDLKFLSTMREAGIAVGVFNLEAFSPDAFARHCPGKNKIGRDHYLQTLQRAVGVFGPGKAWCNFVLGLEPVEELLAGCEALAESGIVPGANILHRDHGASVRHTPPTFDEVLAFYSRLGAVYRQHNLRPYYCQLALRTSLANEAYAERF